VIVGGDESWEVRCRDRRQILRCAQDDVSVFAVDWQEDGSYKTTGRRREDPMASIKMAETQRLATRYSSPVLKE